MRRRSERGFTMLEVLAALAIAAVSLTFLLRSESSSIQGAGRTRDLRQATLFAQAKLQELLAGIEDQATGSFEEREGWSWEATREVVPQAPGAERVVLTVSYTTASGTKTITLEQITR